MDITKLADAAEALFYQRMKEQEDASARCVEHPEATRVFRRDWTQETSPLTYLAQDGGRLIVFSQYDDSIRKVWETGTWAEASQFRDSVEVQTFRPHEWDESDRALGREW